MTPRAFYRGALSCMRLARECRRDATNYDTAWFEYMMAEAERHRQRAIDYLRYRRAILNNEHMDWLR